MNRYQILVEYEGTLYNGWQIQKKGMSIQENIEIVLSKLLKEKIKIYGSGRTDAGVHAKEQSAHFDTTNKIIQKGKLLNSLNFFLNKKKISILKIKKKNKLFHSRYSAKERRYTYLIRNDASPSVINFNREWHIKKKIDVELMKKGAKKLIGTHDFSSFRASGCNAKSPIKLMKLVKIKKLKSKIEFEFRSQSFLKQQVRSMVGCLKFIGEKKWSIKKFVNVIKSKNRKLCAPPAPAEGLYLVKVKY